MGYSCGLDPEEGVKIIKEAVSVCQMEDVPTADAFGRVCAKDIVSAENVPPFARSPYDGYAMRSSDIKNASRENPVTLRIIEEVPAGYAPLQPVGEGEATKILTGAPVPVDADVIEKYESTEFTEEEVKIFSPLKPFTNIVPEGEDIKKGDIIINRGNRITAAGIGMLSSAGITEIPVYKRLKISVMSTGDELVGMNSPLEMGKIRNSSLYCIVSQLNSLGFEVNPKGIVRDDPVLIARAIDEEIKNSDVIITTGGVSVGDYDYMIRVFEKLKADILFSRLNMKPGAAFAAAMYENKPLIALSGNPGSAFITLMMVAYPVLFHMQGALKEPFEKIKVKIKDGFPKKSPQRRLIPGRLVITDGMAVLDADKRQGNGMISPLDGCDILGDIKKGKGKLSPMEEIDAYRFVF